MKITFTNNELTNSFVAINRGTFSGEEIDSVIKIKDKLSSGQSVEGGVVVNLEEEDITTMIVIINRGTYQGTELESGFSLKAKYLSLLEKKEEAPQENSDKPE